MTHQANQTSIKRERYLELLNEITRAAIGTLDLQEMLQTLANRLGALFLADACHIILWDDERQIPVPIAASGSSSEIFQALKIQPGTKTLTGALLKLGHVLAVPNVDLITHIDAEIISQFPSNRSLLGLPFIANGQGLGAAILGFNKPRQFTDQEIAWGEQAAAQIALTIARARLLETEREQRELAETLREASSALNETLDFDELLDRLLELISRVVPYDSAAFMVVESGVARVVRHRGFKKFGTAVSDKIASVTLDVTTTSNLQHMIENGRPLIIPDISQYADWVKIKPFQYISSWAGAPVFIQSELFGIFSLDKQEPDFYQPKHADRLATFAHQAALALSNARLHAETRRQVQELGILHAVALIGATALNEDELIEQTTQIIGDALYSDNFGFLIYDEEIGMLRPHPSYRPANVLGRFPVISVTQGIAGQVFLSGQPCRIGDISQAAAYTEVDPRTRSELCVPLKIHDRVIGVINTESSQLHTFTEADERLLTTLAGQLAPAIERIRLFTAESSRRQEAETLREAIAAVASSLKLEQVLDSILVQLNRVIPYDSAAVLLLEDGNLKHVAGRGFPEDVQAQLQGQYLPTDDSLIWQLIIDGQPILLADAQADPRFRNWGGTNYSHGWMGLPLLVRDTVIGFLTVDNRQVGAYHEWDISLAQSFAQQAATAIEHARLYETTQAARHVADRQANELRVTADILSMLNATPGVLEIFPQMAEIFKQLTDCDRASLFLFDTEKSNTGIMLAVDKDQDGTLAVGTQLTVADTSAAHDILAGQPHFTPNLASETEQPGEYALYRAGFRSRVNIPLTVGQRVIGSLNFAWYTQQGYSTEQQSLLQQIGNAMALAVERSRLFDEANQRTTELEILTNLSSQLRQAVLIDNMLAVIIDTIRQVTTTFFVSILLVEQETNELVVRSEHPPGLGFPNRRLPPNTGVSGHVVQTGQPYVTDDLANDPHVHTLPEERILLQQVSGSITLPLQAQERVIGVIHLAFPKGVIATEVNLRLLIAIAEIAGGALDRALVLENLEQRVAERTHALAEANKRLQELDHLKSKFVSDVSHELRTPITNLKLYLELMERGRSDRQSHYMTVLRQQTVRLAELLEDILSLSRLEMGGEKIKLNPVDLNKVVEQAVTANMPRVEAAELTLHFELQPDLPWVRGERNQLAQVITNLLSNAIRYTPQGAIELQTVWDEEKGMVLTRITDTGIGIHPDDYDYLFDRFYRGQHTGQSNIPGTGLGLAIVKEIVDLHEGEILVQSELGKGATFKVWLPVAEPEDDAA
ncbi:MAG: GAF domain-containing protein [Anaerolineales bacterium]|nr:GAF domain-containing protein [Anaerolineales bacterium]